MSARDPLRELPDPLEEVKDALSFQVSPDFCARVRQQVAAEPGRSRPWVSRRLAIAAALLLASGIGIVTSLRHVNPEVVQVSGPRFAETAGPVNSVEQAPAAAIDPVRVVQRASRVVATGMRPFDTVVPDDQLRALDRLLASMRDGRVTVPAYVSTDEVNDRGERVPRALVIEPVTIALLAGTPAEPNRNPNK